MSIENKGDIHTIFIVHVYTYKKMKIKKYLNNAFSFQAAMSVYLNLSYLQETVLMKEGIIQTLISENKVRTKGCLVTLVSVSHRLSQLFHNLFPQIYQALRSEVGMLEVTFKTIQDTMRHMDEEVREWYLFLADNYLIFDSITKLYKS